MSSRYFQDGSLSKILLYTIPSVALVAGGITSVGLGFKYWADVRAKTLGPNDARPFLILIGLLMLAGAGFLGWLSYGQIKYRSWIKSHPYLTELGEMGE